MISIVATFLRYAELIKLKPEHKVLYQLLQVFMPLVKLVIT